MLRVVLDQYRTWKRSEACFLVTAKLLRGSAEGVGGVAVDRLYVEWLDVSANFLRQSNYVATPSAVAAYLVALQGASNAGEQLSVEGAANFINNAPVDAPFPSTLDTAVLTFRTGSPATVVLTVPAPKSALFLADQETVDPADPTGLIAAAAAALGDVFGASITMYVSGVRAQRRRDVS